MSFLNRIFGRARLKNAEPNTVEEVGQDTSDTVRHGIDLVDTVPFKVNRTIKNCRFASKDPQVKGILTDNITKSNSEWHLEGDSGAVEYLEKRCKEWNLNQMIDDYIFKGQVDGEFFQNIWIVDNKVHVRFLAFDAENYRIKRIYDEFGEVVGYKQLTLRNQYTNKGWLSKKFDELRESLEELTVTLQKGDVINGKYLERNGKGQSIVMDVLEDVYYKRTMKAQLPATVHKNANIVQVTMGNDLDSTKRLTQEDRDEAIRIVSDYHTKGALIFPYGVSAEVLKGGTLPDIPSYLKYIESCIYVGLNTPEAVFTSDSSNRATADIQLDSPTTGRVLFLQYNQEWVKKIIEDELFRLELDLNGFEGKEVKIVFNQEQLKTNPDNQEDSEGNHKQISKKGDDSNSSDNSAFSDSSNRNKNGVGKDGNSQSDT